MNLFLDCTRRSCFVLLAVVCALALAAPSARACSMVGKIHGKVTDHTTGAALESMMVSCGLKNGGWGDTDGTDSAGKYKFEDLSPDTYLVSVDMCCGYVQPDPVEVVLAAGGDVEVNFDLVRVTPDLDTGVISTDPGPDPSSGCIGDSVDVRVRIQYQMMSFEPEELWLWAWDPVANKAIIIADWGASMISNNVEPASWSMTDDGTRTVTEDVIVPWATNGFQMGTSDAVQNGTFILKSALVCSNALDPNSPEYKGVRPPDENTDGTAAGLTLTVDVKNIVITS